MARVRTGAAMMYHRRVKAPLATLNLNHRARSQQQVLATATTAYPAMVVGANWYGPARTSHRTMTPGWTNTFRAVRCIGMIS
jgi:hypothetical protein